ncbi:MAG: radical SAM protein [Firmicutes bacterium]|nr:radical SAM protein [Bacillota bacterium]
MTPEEHVLRAMEYKCPSIAYTYTEPTIFVEYALDIMKLAQAQGLKNVWVTNGYMSRETLDMIIPYLDAANVDFKGPNDGVYEKYCGAKPEPIMDNLKYLHQAGVHLEITTLIVPGVNDQAHQLEKIAQFIAQELSSEVPWHLSRFVPAWKMMDTPITAIETLEMAETLGEKAGLKYIHLGNV